MERRVNLVMQLFDRLDQEIATFQGQTKLHCLSGCGQCCTKPDIDASPLEFLPWAYHLFLNREAQNMLDKLNSNSSPLCQLYRPLTTTDNKEGKCGNYLDRGLICRLFGYAASKDKYGQQRLVTCKIIKEDQKKNYDRSLDLISSGTHTPNFSDYYMNLSQIDFRLGTITLPINKALKMALEEVLQYYAYRPFPEPIKKIA